MVHSVGEKPAHFIVIPTAAWGHIRPLFHLSLNILVTHPSLHCTVLLSPSSVSLAQKELRSPSFAHIHIPRQGGDSITDRLQIINVHSSGLELKTEYGPEVMADQALDFAKSLPEYLTALFTGDQQLRENENKFWNIVPDFVIFDVFQSFVPVTLTQLLGPLGQTMVPTLGFFPCNAVASYDHFASAAHGGMLEIVKQNVEIDVTNGLPLLEAYDKRGFAGYGEVRDPPGLGKMYDWEIYPNIGSVPLPPQIMQQVTSSLDAIHHPALTALILPHTPELELEAVAALRRELGKDIIMAGMQFPDSVWEGDDVARAGTSQDDHRVMGFLDRMERKHGKDSVFYVSFGSAFFPVLRPELVNYLLETLSDQTIPFVFAHGSFLEQLPRELLDNINAREDSIEVKFAPQWAVLQHPATGFFVSHCGSNSTAEAILSEQVVASFPFAADQGEFAALLVKHGVAIDLKQVKTPKPRTFTRMYDGTEIVGTEEAIKAEMVDVFARMRGEQGKTMRDNVRKLKAACTESWKRGGAREAMESIKKYF